MESSTPDKPTLVYDGDCSFCKLWIQRWQNLTEARVQYSPFQEAAAQFPTIPRESFARSVQLILPDGEVLSAAHAVLRTLTFAPGWAWVLWIYRRLPGAATVFELVYGWVARHRNFLYRATRLFWGRHFERPSFSLACWLFLRLLGVTFFFAFLSLSTQIIGLVGHQGILPIADYLHLIASHVGPERYWFFPTLAWLSASDGALGLMSVGGILASLLLIFDIAPLVATSVSWILYLSLLTAGQEFLAFQWDNLLLEAGFLAILLAPWRLWPHRAYSAGPPRVPRWSLWFLLFRLMFSSGVVKLVSGDSTWRDLSALGYHYYTQPLPTPIAWYMNLLPTGFQHASVVFVLGVELIVPFLIFTPRLWRFAGGGLLIFLQILIALTGNYAFFNLLTIALCLLLFDDAFWKRLLPRVLSEHVGVAGRAPRRFSVRRWITAPVAVVVLLAGLCQVAGLFRRDLPGPASELLSGLEPARIVNGYGLFAVMTTTRPEIVIEGSNDGSTWLAYEFKFKPGDLRRAPRWVEPFQPRLDWQMWFAALGDRSGSPWFTNLMVRLLRGSPPVLALLGRNPFPQAPPKYIRALIYDYEFTGWHERWSERKWWDRKLLGGYFPVATLRPAPGMDSP
jgi:predicted DCC family thiol-disulfide oxidoreductase YuxK